MIMDKSLNNLLPEVSENCFKQNEFSNHEFEVDLFIKKHQDNMPLEQLREDLSIYLRNLRLSLVDLINCDYEEFMHLTSNYIDLNNNINNLTYSLNELKKDVQKSNQEIQSTIDKLNENLDYIRMTLKQKRDLNFILKASKMIKKIECDLIEIGDEQSNDKFNQNFGKIFYQLNLINQRINKLSLNSTYVNQTFKIKLDHLNEELNNYLKIKIEQFIEEQNSNGINDLLEISVLNQQYNQFIDLIFQKVFKKQLQDFICDLNIEKYGVVNFFDQLFDLCDNEFRLFNNIKTVQIHLLDSLIDCISKKIYNNLTINASTLFLAGDPEIFILNFKVTINFFKRLLSLNSKSKSPEQFQIFNEIKQKFNCEIYFHIRLSEVSDELSRALEKPILIDQQSVFVNQIANQSNIQQFNQLDEQNIRIQLIEQLLKILNFIWSDQIYLNTLFYDFWRLTLLLISRYTLFLKQFQSNQLANNLNTNYYLQSLILIRLINETSLLINSIQQIYSTVIKSKIPINCNEFELTNCLNQSFDTIFIVGLPSVYELLKNVFCAQCSMILNQIKEIPRLYRKTNRDVPTKPSNYIVNCVDLFQHLRLIQNCSSNLILDILNKVTDNFYDLANEVLKSLQKMEESLMRLKKVQQSSNGNLKNSDKKASMSDADKIRLQFKLDVFYYDNGIKKLNLDQMNLINLNALIKLAENF